MNILRYVILCNNFKLFALIVNPFIQSGSKNIIKTIRRISNKHEHLVVFKRPFCVSLLTYSLGDIHLTH